MGQIKMKVNGKDKTVGMKVRCQVVKNRMGPPLRAADFEIYFDRGIDNYGSWLSVMKENKLVKQAGAWYAYVDTETGEEFKFQSKDFIPLMDENTELREQIYKKICETTILQYKGNTLDIDAMEIDTKGAGVNE
jgi:recombination protein RecA